jgi:hypothetical protein
VVSFVRCLGRCLCVGSISRPEDFYWARIFWVWNLDSSEAQTHYGMYRLEKKSVCSKDPNAEYRFLSCSVLRWRVSVTFTTVCSMTIDEICTGKYLQQTEEGEWQATNFLPNSSEIFTKFRKIVNEDRRIEHWNSRNSGTYFFLFMSHICPMIPSEVFQL